MWVHPILVYNYSLVRWQSHVHSQHLMKSDEFTVDCRSPPDSQPGQWTPSFTPLWASLGKPHSTDCMVYQCLSPDWFTKAIHSPTGFPWRCINSLLCCSFCGVSDAVDNTKTFVLFYARCEQVETRSIPINFYNLGARTLLGAPGLTASKTRCY